MSSLNDILENNIQTLINSAKSVERIPHQGLKGAGREEFLSEFLEKYLPHQWGIGRGLIQDSLGNISRESDLIIYDRNSLPPTLIGKSNNIFPIECVKYVFEVKSTLRSSEIRDSIKKFEKLKSLYTIKGKSPIRVLFGFNSDLIEKSEINRLMELDTNFEKNSAIQVLVVIGKGYWFNSMRITELKEQEKVVVSNVIYKLNPSPDVVELKSFLFALLDTLNPDLPSFSSYFKIPSGVDSKLHEEYQFFVKEEEYQIKNLENLELININNSLRIDTISEVIKKNNFFSLKKKKPKHNKLFQAKFISESTSSTVKYSIPKCQIEINNSGNEKLTIKSCHILTSKGLRFFINFEESVLKYPIVVEPDESVILTSGFLCFKKHQKSNNIGGEFIFEKGDVYGNHNYIFIDKMINIDYAVVEIITIQGSVKYSDEFSLTDFISFEENKDLDFIIDYNSLTHILSNNSDYTKQIISNHGRR